MTTLSTIKAFVRKNAANLYIKCGASFDGMTDCVQVIEGATLRKVDPASINWENRNTLGIPGAWFVCRSRDHFSPASLPGFTGYEISNCCGWFSLFTPGGVTEAR